MCTVNIVIYHPYPETPSGVKGLIIQAGRSVVSHLRKGISPMVLATLQVANIQWLLHIPVLRASPLPPVLDIADGPFFP